MIIKLKYTLAFLFCLVFFDLTFAAPAPPVTDACTGDSVHGEILQIPNFSGYFDGENEYGLETVVKVTIVGSSQTTVLFDEIDSTFANYSVTAPHCGTVTATVLIDAIPDGNGGFIPNMKLGRFMLDYLTPDHGATWFLNSPTSELTGVPLSGFSPLFYKQE